MARRLGFFFVSLLLLFPHRIVPNKYSPTDHQIDRSMCKSHKNEGSELMTHVVVKIAHATLTRAGLLLHAFTSCSAALAPHKTVYFRLLQVLKTRRYDIQLDLRGACFDSFFSQHADLVLIAMSFVTVRMNRLLLPLSTRMIIRRKGEPPIRSPSHSAWDSRTRSSGSNSSSRHPRGPAMTSMPGICKSYCVDP